jgi:hypothetical protein
MIESQRASRRVDLICLTQPIAYPTLVPLL